MGKRRRNEDTSAHPPASRAATGSDDAGPAGTGQPLDGEASTTDGQGRDGRGWRAAGRAAQVAAATTLAGLLATAVWQFGTGLVRQLRQPTHKPTVPVAGSASPSPAAIPVRRTGTLVMPSNVAFDLDSTAPDWEPTKGEWGNAREIAYAGWVPDLKKDALIGLGFYWDNVAALPGTGPWTRADCAGATYGLDSARPVGDRIALGHGVCVQTTAGRLALLVVTDRHDGSITVTATVWER